MNASRGTTLRRRASYVGWCCGLVLGMLPPGAAHATLDPYAVVDRFADVLVRVERDYVDPVDRLRLLEGAAAGMVAELDPHSAYLTPAEFSQFLEDTEGRFAGIGVEVDFRDDQVTVVATMPGSPAERAGLQSGDRIVAIDGLPIAHVRAEALVKRMRGPEGTQVRLTLRRVGQPDPIVVTITRAIVSVPSVEGRCLAGGIAYVRLKAFQEGCYVALLDELARLSQETHLRGLLLDLRSNPGGLVSEALAIADEFLGAGVIYSARHRGKVVESVRSYDGDVLEKLPLVVLVNAATASSAEIVAGAIQDRARGKIVGVPTFGKGSVQSIIELTGGAGLLLTTLRYFTPSGRAIQAKGIVPNVLVDSGRDRESPREADIEGHLPTEGEATGASATAATESPPAKSAEGAPAPKAPPAPAERIPLEQIAPKPSAESDPILAKGFELLTAAHR